MSRFETLQRIRNIRRTRGLSQADVANELLLVRGTYATYESGQVKCDERLLDHIEETVRNMALPAKAPRLRLPKSDQEPVMQEIITDNLLHEAVLYLTDYRRKHGVTQSKLAEKLGVSRTVITAWERGSYLPRPEKYQKIVDFLRSESK